jgi:aminoglycoside phosphotransferase (APT) family kinase protein
VAPFSYLAADHPLAPALERFRAAIAARGLDVSGATVHTDLTLRDDDDADDGGCLELHRAYWSAQWPGPDGFRATTLDYRAKGDRATWLEFPEDPQLPALRTLGGVVLRYMPLRRCTARADGAVAKVKRPRRAAEAWALLRAVHDALGDERAGFAVPAPLRYDAERATYEQTVVAGDDLATVLDEDRMRRAGALHRTMHAAEVPGVPQEDPGQAVADLRDDARWVSVALPEHADAVRAVLDLLERHAPGRPPHPAFCHGDLTPSQLLVDGDRWAITDFDGARIGDPHRDLAIWLASLPLEAPGLAPSAEAAYLDGYGAHDERRLRWWRAAAEVHYVAVALKKDRHDPARTARALDVARECAEDL